MPKRETFITGEIYHIYNRSIAKFKIFNNEKTCERMCQLMRYYQIYPTINKLSKFMKLQIVKKSGFEEIFNLTVQGKEKLVQIIAYCLMPTHIHLILKQVRDDGIGHYMRKIFDGYSCYFNVKHKRKGPLWEGRFKSVRVKKDEQLMHLTRYIHLNPVTANLVNRPEDWDYSSYREYISSAKEKKVCDYSDVLDIKRGSYTKFVKDQISYQKNLAEIKHLVLD